MNKNEIKNSSDMFLYKSIIDLNSAKYLLEAFNEDKIEIDIELMNDIDKLIELSDYAVEGRYSIIRDDINEADKYIKILETLLDTLSDA